MNLIANKLFFDLHPPEPTNKIHHTLDFDFLWQSCHFTPPLFYWLLRHLRIIFKINMILFNPDAEISA